VTQPVRRTHHDDLITHPDLIGVGQLCGPQAGWDLVELNEGQVSRQLW